MTFFVFTVNGHEHMSLEKVLRERKTSKVGPSGGIRAIDEKEYHPASSSRGRSPSESAYQTVAQLPVAPKVLFVEAVMTTPVTTVTPETLIAEALDQFHARNFRHMPVVLPEGRLVGIASERDILRYLAGKSPRDSVATNMETVMTPEVLTADIHTDVRHVARLFVERRIGALPVVSTGRLRGIITRGDVLRAVMRNFNMELWA